MLIGACYLGLLVIFVGISIFFLVEIVSVNDAHEQGVAERRSIADAYIAASEERMKNSE